MSLGQREVFFREQLVRVPKTVLRERAILLFFWPFLPGGYFDLRRRRDIFFLFPRPYVFFLFFWKRLIFLLRFVFFGHFPFPFRIVQRRRLLRDGLFLPISVDNLFLLLFEPFPDIILLPIFFKDSLPRLLREDLSALPAITSDNTFFPYSFADGSTHSFRNGKAFLPTWLRMDHKPRPLASLLFL